MRLLAWLITGWLISIFIPNKNTLLFFYVPVLVLIYLIPLRLAFRFLRVQIVEWAAQVNGGENINFTVDLKNSWPLPLLNLKAEMYMENLLNQRIERFELVFDLNPLSNQLITWTCPPLPRGKYRMASLALTGRDFFGLVKWNRTQNLTGEIKVFPTILPWAPDCYLEGYTSGKQKLIAHGYNSTMSVGVRNYTRGDNLARIHWKATARLGKMLSREFTEETGDLRNIVIGYGGNSDRDNEALIMAGASLAWGYFQKGLEFRFLLYAGQESDLGLIRTREDIEALLEILTVAVPKQESVDLEGLADFLHQALDPDEGELILLTGVRAEELPENLLQTGYKPVVVTVPPELTRAGIVEILEGIGQC